jgi:hypothetical protein
MHDQAQEQPGNERPKPEGPATQGIGRNGNAEPALEPVDLEEVSATAVSR